MSRIGQPFGSLPEGARWPDIATLSGLNLLNHYRETLLKLSRSTDPLLAAIYADAQTRLKEPRHLEQLIKSIDAIDWFSAQRNKAFIGTELVPGTRRLVLMNCLLHGMEGDAAGVVHLDNPLGQAGSDLLRSDIILSNPPLPSKHSPSMVGRLAR